MKMLTLSVLLCAIVALTTAAAVPGVKDEGGSVAVKEGGDQHVVKRYSRCPRGWYEHNDRCFIYVPQRRTWAEAESYCLSVGANLASVHSLDEYRWLRRMITDVSHGYPVTWIGGSDSEQDGKWFWSDGTPFTFSNWCSGEPSNYHGAQDCLQINYSGHKCWDDDFCSEQKPSVCAKKI